MGSNLLGIIKQLRCVRFWDSYWQTHIGMYLWTVVYACVLLTNEESSCLFLPLCCASLCTSTTGGSHRTDTSSAPTRRLHASGYLGCYVSVGINITYTQNNRVNLCLTSVSLWGKWILYVQHVTCCNGTDQSYLVGLLPAMTCSYS